METFMDKLAEKLTAEEMIKANAEAEARELARLQKQVREYQECLEQMKQVGEQIQSDTHLLERLQEMVARQEEALESQKGSVRDLFTQADENVHKENVKVYRNVQAVVIETADKQKEYLQNKMEESAKKVRGEVKGRLTAVLTFSILAFLLSLATLTFQLLTHFGIL